MESAVFVEFHGKCHVCGLWAFLQHGLEKCVCEWRQEAEAGALGELIIQREDGGETNNFKNFFFREQSRD